MKNCPFVKILRGSNWPMQTNVMCRCYMLIHVFLVPVEAQMPWAVWVVENFNVDLRSLRTLPDCDAVVFPIFNSRHRQL